ncbi:MAG: hypothetical protein HETSPECPRED_009613 [Heterodermia speciosa]|uniref:Uncharacterized protein n=1 Tax=Heterodermia speciosa TaxID=116794 RepID=A0A8H3ETH1_9LECA|nr:MAG: hypothetical protein HETSPECPRED_009613 [Heterodermia speciosa]
MVPQPTYINNLTPHPAPLETKADPNINIKPEDPIPNIKLEDSKPALLSPPISPPFPPDPSTTHPLPPDPSTTHPLLPDPSTHPLPPDPSTPCPHGCIPAPTYGEIAHYSRLPSTNNPFPFTPGFPPYDTLPPLASCKVVLLRGGTWSDEILPRGELRSWMPCWVITTTTPAATTTPHPLLLLPLSNTFPKSPTQLSTISNTISSTISTSTNPPAPVAKTGKWAPFSGIVVERYPRFVPRESLHRVQEGRRVVLTKGSCRRLRVVFSHRGEMREEGDLGVCLGRAKR